MIREEWLQAIEASGAFTRQDKDVARALHSFGRAKINASLKVIGRAASRFPHEVRRSLCQLEAKSFLSLEPNVPLGFIIRLRLPKVPGP